MLLKEFLLFLVPVAAVAIVSFAGYTLGERSRLQLEQQQEPNPQLSNSPKALSETSTVAECPIAYVGQHCSNLKLPVMNGIDLVSYFKEFEGVGRYGSPQHNSTFQGYSFLFMNEHHKILFEADPVKFMPQYGGFCAWAVSGETNPVVHPWAADCLGPSGDPSVWTLINDKLYFFRYQQSKDNFLANSIASVKAGDERWAQWFPTEQGSTFDTVCSAATFPPR